MLNRISTITAPVFTSVAGMTSTEDLRKAVEATFGTREAARLKSDAQFIAQVWGTLDWMMKVANGGSILDDAAYKYAAELISQAAQEYRVMEDPSTGTQKARKVWSTVYDEAQRAYAKVLLALSTMPAELPLKQTINAAITEPLRSAGIMFSIMDPKLYSEFLYALAGAETSFGTNLDHQGARVGTDVGAFGINTAFHQDRVRTYSDTRDGQFIMTIFEWAYLKNTYVIKAIKDLTKHYNDPNKKKSGTPRIDFDIEGLAMMYIATLDDLFEQKKFLSGEELAVYMLNFWKNPENAHKMLAGTIPYERNLANGRQYLQNAKRQMGPVKPQAPRATRK